MKHGEALRGLIYQAPHGKVKHYQPYEKTTKITDVMKQTDNILESYYPNSNLIDAQGLSRAYGNGKGFYIDGDKMYVAGTFGKGTFGGAVNDILADVGLPFKMTNIRNDIKTHQKHWMKTMKLNTL